MTPDRYTLSEQMLDVGDGHSLYVQEWGNKKAETTIILLHGGPGSKTKDKHKNAFDPTKQHVIFFDQRGSGNSLPYSSLINNTTEKLIADISKIADTFSIKKFVLTGGSWGSCLALSYALKYPARVEALVLYGIFTGSKSEIDWLDRGGYKAYFPDVWDQYIAATPKNHHSNPSAYHKKQALSTDINASKQSAYAYRSMEGAVIALNDEFIPESYDEFDAAGAKIEMYYLMNGCFMPDRYILNNAHKLTMPVWLIQGRYDSVCPPITAYELNKKLPNSKLIWTISGHAPEHETVTHLRSILSQF